MILKIVQDSNQTEIMNRVGYKTRLKNLLYLLGGLS